MKILAYVVVLCCYAAGAATGRDLREMNRDRFIICSQFVIEDPEPVMVGKNPQYCCRLANRMHDCHFGEWNGQDS